MENNEIITATEGMEIDCINLKDKVVGGLIGATITLMSVVAFNVFIKPRIKKSKTEIVKVDEPIDTIEAECVEEIEE